MIKVVENHLLERVYLFYINKPTRYTTITFLHRFSTGSIFNFGTKKKHMPVTGIKTQGRLIILVLFTFQMLRYKQFLFVSHIALDMMNEVAV